MRFQIRFFTIYQNWSKKVQGPKNKSREDSHSDWDLAGSVNNLPPGSGWVNKDYESVDPYPEEIFTDPQNWFGTRLILSRDRSKISSDGDLHPSFFRSMATDTGPFYIKMQVVLSNSYLFPYFSCHLVSQWYRYRYLGCLIDLLKHFMLRFWLQLKKCGPWSDSTISQKFLSCISADLVFLATLKILCFMPTGGGHSAVGNRGFFSRYRGSHAALHLLGWGPQPAGGMHVDFFYSTGTVPVLYTVNCTVP